MIKYLGIVIESYIFKDIIPLLILEGMKNCGADMGLKLITINLYP